MQLSKRMLLASAVLASALAAAQVPSKLGYSGRLLKNTGAPETGAATIEFAVYDAASGGSALWTETQSLLLSGDGAYSTFLGEVTSLPASLFDGSGNRFLELKVNGGAPLTPRQPINSVPYALTARNVKGGAADVTSLKVNGQDVISNGKLASQFGYGAGSGIAIDASNGISLTGCTAQNQVLVWDAGASKWNCGSVTGASGATGAQGLAGATGQTGAAGATGSTGPVSSVPASLEWESAALSFSLAGPRATVTLVNTGDVAVSGLSVTASTGFKVVSSCAASLPGRGRCAVTIALVYGAALPASGTLTAGNGSLTAITALARPATSCKALLAASAGLPDGTYFIDPDGTAGAPPFAARCDMTTDGGGWTMIASLVNSDGVTNWTQFGSGANGIPNWRNGALFGTLDGFAVSDYKSPAFVTVVGDDLLVVDDSGGWLRAGAVLGAKTLRDRLLQVTTCQTAPLLAPGSPQIASSNAVAASNAFFSLYGGDPNNSNLCPLNFGVDTTDAAVIVLGGTGCQSVGLGYVGYLAPSGQTDADTTFCLSSAPSLAGGGCGNWYATPPILYGACNTNTLFVR